MEMHENSSQDTPKKRKWTPFDKHKQAIIRRLGALGVYRPQYVAVIDRLADLYVRGEELEKQREQLEGTPAGDKLLHKLHMDLITQTLAHERELGLTPAALKRLMKDEVQKPGKSRSEEVLEQLEKER